MTGFVYKKMKDSY